MKKITKLLSVLLAIAVIICPMMSAVVVNAENTTGNGYSLTRVDATNLQLTIDSTTGFLVYQATVELADTTVSTFSLESYTVKSPATNDSHNYPTVTSHQDGKNVTFIVASTDANCLDLYTQVKINFTVTSGTTATLTKIQAADNGNGQDVSSDPTLLDFSGAGVGTDGTVDLESDYAKENAKPHEHNYVWNEVVGDGHHTLVCTCEDETEEACNTNGTNGACSVCGYKASTVCTHENKTFVSATPATDSAKGSLTFHCDVCNKDINVETTYVEKYKFSFTNIELQSEILMSIRMLETNYNTNGAVNDGFIIATHDTDIAQNGKSVQQIPFDDFKVTSNKVGSTPYVTYAFGVKVPSVDMAKEYAICSYFRVGETWYCGKTLSKTLCDMVSGNYDSMDSSNKQLLVDMLVYGAAAQTNFGYNTDKLATAVLTPTMLASATQDEPSFTSVCNNAVRDASKGWYATVINKSLELQSKVLFKPVTQLRFYSEAGNSLDDVKCVISYTDAWGADHNDEMVLPSSQQANADGSNVMIPGYMNSQTAYTAMYSNFTACDFRKTFTITYYDGDTAISDGYTYSVESFVAEYYSSATVNAKAMYIAMLKYGDSAFRCFAS